ncbi:uncharacterized protein F4817DRAFT_350147 [Daldinia loculata]|uniref:uncharacterized protein n=1 Tax=Daldinia loculata TaxID=103429 RepID=UPI0020C2E095|nr:uncharacterized protein F4817DRAFT_350147 [Daldinia loculata]KAI1643392.1 hypothetical protein F4817DRAFT_350147 [Daldinia loculata]
MRQSRGGTSRLLLKNKTDPNSRDNHGRTALHCAIKQHLEISVELAQELLENGADPNIQDAAGETPLHEAANVLPRRVRGV